MLEEKLDYFTSIWNIIDLTNFSIFMIYFFMRMFMQIDKYLPMHQMDIFNADSEQTETLSRNEIHAVAFMTVANVV